MDELIVWLLTSLIFTLFLYGTFPILFACIKGNSLDVKNIRRFALLSMARSQWL